MTDVQGQLQPTSRRYLTFYVSGQLYALKSEEVREVVRVPAMVRLPQGPPALLGIGNLRGAVLPFAGLQQLLGKPASVHRSTAQAIVLDIGDPIAVVVDSVAALEYATEEQIDRRQKDVSAQDGERLLGVFSVGADKTVAKILDIEVLLKSAFVNRARAERRTLPLRATTSEHAPAHPSEIADTLVTFDVAGQEFGLPLAEVQEIIPCPQSVAALAHTEAVVLGIASVRNTLLPLLSLRILLGLPPGQSAPEREKVLIVRVGSARVGLVADGARAIVAAESRLIDPVPPALAARIGGESRIRAVYRGEGGRRLISILSSQQLFREDVMQKLSAGQLPQGDDEKSVDSVAHEELIFLVFRLGEDEFALPIDAVVEVAPVPEQITRLPKTPKFLEGVVNLRGEVLPVIDQRRRFEMPPLGNLDARRLVVIRTERHRAGLIVDSVSDVLRSSANAIEPAPELTEETSRLVRGVVNLPSADRIVLLLDPTELLTRAERGLLDKFEAQRQRTDA